MRSAGKGSRVEADMRRVAVVLAIALAIGAFWWLRPPVRVAYVGGAVLTMDAQDRVVGGVAIEGERIAQVGGEAEIRA